MAGGQAAPAQAASGAQPAAGTSEDQQVGAADPSQQAQGAGAGGEELSERVKRIEQMLQGLAGGPGQQPPQQQQVPAA